MGLTKTNDADYSDSTGFTGDFEIDNAINLSVAAGRNISDRSRVELELSHRKADLDQLTIDGTGSFDLTGDLKTTTAMVNGYYDLIGGKKFSPYVSAGLGFAKHDGEIVAGGISVNEDDTVLAYQVGAGASYDIASRTALFGGYRYAGTADPEFGTLDADYDAHEVRVGVRYDF